MPQTRYPPHNTSNPFAGFNPPSIPQSSHLQHPNANIQHHPGFGAAGSNGGMNIFGPQTGNGGIPIFGAGSGLGGGETGLASREAQLRFAQGAVLQQQAHEAANPGAYPTRGVNTRVREVWQSNLNQEFDLIRQLVDKYPYISMVCCYLLNRPRPEQANTSRTLNFQGSWRVRLETFQAKPATIIRPFEPMSIS